MQAECYTISRSTLRVNTHFTAHTWELSRDYLTNERSSFSTAGNKDVDVAEGDYLVVKFVEHKNIVPTYVGIVDGIDDNQITACDIYNMLNFETVSVRLAGTNLSQHLNDLVDQYLLTPADKNASNITINVYGSEIPYTYQPENPPATMNLTDYFIEAFKKYGVLWEATGVANNDGMYTITTKLGLPNSFGIIRDNVYDIINWNVMVTPSGGAAQNKINIIDNKTTSLTDPDILDTWYVTTGGEIVHTYDPGTVTTPTKEKIYLYDQSAADKPAYEDVASAELSSSRYSHEITFDVSLNNKVAGWDWLFLGNRIVVIYQKVRYDSIITGYRFDGANPLLSVRLGYIRSNFKQVIQELGGGR